MSPPRPEVLAFLQDIKEYPDDDAPRLIFADWLDEHGDPRGEFVRLQCQLARMRVDDPRFEEMGRRQRSLQERHEGDWLRLIRDVGREWEFRRGLLQCRFGSGNIQWPDYNAAAENWAWVESVRVDGYLREVITSGSLFLAQVPTLRLDGHIFDDAGWIAFLGAPERRWLYELEINQGSLRAAVGVMAASEAFSRLHTLVLVRNRLGQEGGMALAASRRFDRLSWLRIAQNKLDTRAVRALAEAPFLKRLTVLDLQYNRIDPEGAISLAASPLTRLEFLGLANNRIGPAGAAALASSPHLHRLKAIDLTDNFLGDEGAVVLANSPLVGQLNLLKLAYNRITRSGADALGRSPFRGPALAIDLSGNSINP
jgi:uncharacterized protein (TIGR02996 family)